jgi:hypothetical protein
MDRPAVEGARPKCLLDLGADVRGGKNSHYSHICLGKPRVTLLENSTSGKRNLLAKLDLESTALFQNW